MPRSRRRESVLDDLFDLFQRAPWWVGPGVAGGVFAAVRWGVPWVLRANAEGTVTERAFPLFADAIAGVAPVAGGLVLFVWIVALLKKHTPR